MNLLKTIFSITIIALLTLGIACKPKQKKSTAETPGMDTPMTFPVELVSFSPEPEKPLFTGTGTNTWDAQIRERGFILFDEGVYKLWYTGYNDSISEKRFLGLALSDDGVHWKRHAQKPLLPSVWVEDMFVHKENDRYYMFAEGRNDVAHLLVSQNGIDWEPQGNLNINKANGIPLDPGPYGTPTVWVENGEKYLFYERNDLGIWLAKSDDFINWTNVQDEPVLDLGPGTYDEAAVAANQVIKYKGKYYMYYHGSDNPDWNNKNVVALWSSNVAVSKDLLHWTKYEGNPIVQGDFSSNIVVFDGKSHVLYTTHDKVKRYAHAAK
ncbi:MULTISPECIES: glycosylase [Flavobacteriaceae]|uniref:glycoside hydrolase family 130 protein n=1 Tax=Flavobacteriaceae TaxID=49546 RepID=UPI0014910D68|nr:MULTISPECIES: glycosylase [Allomuricauda]MDC6366825.1 hypothetical protein [Muricauda sp. AC10]